MEANPLRTRGIALEESYFRRLEAERLERVRAERSRARLRAELGAELEFQNHALLEHLIELGVTPDTAAAFEALPLVEVAWADGSVDSEERWRTLASATSFGLELGRPAHSQLEVWLDERPSQELFDAWYRFAERRLAQPEMAQRARRVLEGADEVAKATGGLLGFGAVSRSERAAIARIRQSLGRPPAEPS